MVQEKYNTLIEQAELYGEDKAAIEAMQAAEIKDINDKAAAQELATKKATQQQGLALAQQSTSALMALNDAFVAKTEKGAKRQFQINKALSIAQVAIQTVSGVSAAFASNAANVGATVASMGAFPFVQAGIAAVFGAAQIAAIASTQYKAGDGGGGGGAASGLTASGGGSAPSAPQFNTVGTSGFNQINESLNNNNRNPTKAYVVSGEVSSAQSLDRNRIKEATFP